MIKKNLKIKNGYTIIETMIAVSLFIIIVMVGMGALLSANSLHRKSQGMRSVMDNLSFIMEDISRNLRTGYSFHCIAPGDTVPVISVSTPKSCATGGWGIAFEYTKGNPSNDDDQWVYYIDDGKIFKSTLGSDLSNFIQLTPDEIVIDSASSFTVLGAEPPPDDLQPFVTIKLIGTITFKDIITPFSLQTSVSQRNIDI
jgi:hypothetical protein